MKYWFFNGNDVVGPFTVKELTQQKSFSETSLVCPENFSDDQDHWQVAATFAELKPFVVHTPDPLENTTTFEQELDTLLNEKSPLAFDETPSEGPGMEIPKKPAKPGPIEEYFNRVKEEDLGDILGIPNPNDNSDMDLAHALEKQLAKTSSTRREKQEAAVDEQTAAELTQASATHHVATATEVFGPQTPTTAPQTTQAQSAPQATQAQKNPEPTLSMPTVEPETMPVLAQEPIVKPAAQEPVITPAAQETQNENPQPTPTIQTSLPAEEKDALISPQDSVEIITDPTLLRKEKVEVNSVRAHLKQTQEMKDFLNETQNTRLKHRAETQRRTIVMLLAVLAIIAGLLLALQLRPKEEKLAVASVPSTMPSAELLEEPVEPASLVVQPAASLSQEQKALSIVQNYPLSNQRGSLASYLNRIYKSQLAQGYQAIWQAEPLYKNTYIVKYQLTKTRKEPIIYVFQADVAQGKLTGALNNISLDLVGKI